MTISLDETAIILTGRCGVDEAETLVDYLEKQPGLPVDVGAATMIHTALWQALMVFRPRIIGSPASSVVADRVMLGLNAYLHENAES